MDCAICNKPKDKVIPTASLLGSEIFACRTCITQGYQPRWAIIIAARTYGRAAVWQYIEKDKYYGDKITAKELGNE
jgi:hypothetical protein